LTNRKILGGTGESLLEQEIGGDLVEIGCTNQFLKAAPVMRAGAVPGEPKPRVHAGELIPSLPRPT